MLNEMDMTLNLKRIDVCDLELACLAAKELANDEGKKWDRLYKVLKEQLNTFDKSMGY